jgi:hypothetical protein
MPIYTCNKCKKEFIRKSSYNVHILRINSCIKDDNINNECSYCKKIYSTKYNLSIHIDTCKEKLNTDQTQSQIEELKKMLFDQHKKIEEQQKQIDDLSHLTENSGNITVNNENSHNTTTNNNTTNVINIYNAGKEDLSHLSKEDVITICTSGTYYPIVAAKILHCNEKYPQYQNFLISNLRAATGQVKINDDWVTQSQDEILTNLMRVDKRHVSTLMKNLKVDDKLKVKLESTQDEIDIGESKEHQKPKIKNMLYQKSRMITKNKRESVKN